MSTMKNRDLLAVAIEELVVARVRLLPLCETKVERVKEARRRLRVALAACFPDE